MHISPLSTFHRNTGETSTAFLEVKIVGSYRYRVVMIFRQSASSMG